MQLLMKIIFICKSLIHLTESCDKFSMEEMIKKLKAEGHCFACLKRKLLIRNSTVKTKRQFYFRLHNSLLCNYLVIKVNKSKKRYE